MRRGLGACFVVLGACGGGSSSPLSPASQAPATAWVRQFGGIETQSARVVRLAATGDRVVAVGRLHGAISFDGIVVDARVPPWSDGGFFLVLDGAGRAVAARRLDGAEAFPFDVADLSIDARGHAYVVGVHAAMKGRESYVLQKLDLAGQVAWTRAWRPPPLSVPHTAGGFDSGCLRIVADDAAVFVAGNDDAVTFLEKRNDAGDVVWRREVAHATGLDCPEIAADGEGGVVVAGGYAVGADHFDLVRFDPSGQTTWTLPFPAGPRVDVARFVALGHPTIVGAEIVVAGSRVAARSPPADFVARSPNDFVPPPQIPRPEAFVARVARQDGRLLDVRRAWTGAPSDVREIVVGAGGVLTVLARDAWYSPPRERSVLARYDAGGVQTWHRTTAGEAFEWTAVASARGAVVAAGQLRTTADVGGGVMTKRSTTGDLVIVGGVR